MSFDQPTADSKIVLGEWREDTYLVRRATLHDLPAIDDLANDILEEHGLPRDSAVALRDAQYFYPDYGDRGEPFQFWVAKLAARVVGSAAIVPGSAGGYLDNVAFPAHGSGRAGRLFHGFADAVRHEPSGLVRYAERAVQLVSDPQETYY